MPDDKAVQAYLHRVDQADSLWELNRDGEHALAGGRFGEKGGGALAKFREALAIAARAAARDAGAGGGGERDDPQRRSSPARMATSPPRNAGWTQRRRSARRCPRCPMRSRRIERMRGARIARLRDVGIAALLQDGGIATARRRLAEILLIARPGRPGRGGTARAHRSGRALRPVPPGPEFHRRAEERRARAADGGRAARRLPHGRERRRRSRPRTTSGRRATSVSTAASRCRSPKSRWATSAASSTPPARRTRAARRGYSMAYDERSGNFARVSGVDWRSDYVGKPRGRGPAGAARQRQAMPKPMRSGCRQQSGQHYRLPSEAEFEYALRAGSAGALSVGQRRAAGEGRQLHRRARPFAERPALEQCLRRLWRRLLGAGAGRAASRRMHGAFTTWPAMSASGSPIAGTMVIGARPADGAAWVNPGMPDARGARRFAGPVRRRRPVRHGARRRPWTAPMRGSVSGSCANI